ncbi:MAG: DegT/DnrJ/EryC1/StrS family aminotransferase [bacterium]|nr:MAG: DegT/DnrJ/EryC1/StrS family aminotransferase [bacterium]
MSNRIKITWSEPYIGENDFYALKSCFEAKWISQGKKVTEFEKRVALCADREFCVAVNSGSSALICSLIALGIGPDSEVIIPAMSFIALPHAIHLVGAIPVLADIDKKTGIITSETVRPCITEKTKAIIGIDYSGHTNDYNDLYDLCRQMEIAFIADAASSFLATNNGVPAGSIGDVAVFSFHSAKPITTGEGGAIVTNNKEMYRAMQEIRNHGEIDGKKYVYHRLGSNFRMTDVAAALGVSQIENSDFIIRKRGYVIKKYLESQILKEHAYIYFTDPKYVSNGFSFTVLINNRDNIQQSLYQSGIETRSMWPLCVHEQPIYKKLKLKMAADYIGARSFSRTCLSLPVHCSLDDDAIDFIKDKIEKQIS